MQHKKFIKNGYRKLAFYMDDVSAGQLSYEVLNAIEEYNKRDEVDTDVCIFVNNLSSPCIMPDCPVYHARYIRMYDGHIFATSQSTLSDLHKAQRAQKHLYLYENLEYSRENVDLIIARSKEYNKNAHYLKFVNIEQILNIIKENNES